MCVFYFKLPEIKHYKHIYSYVSPFPKRKAQLHHWITDILNFWPSRCHLKCKQSILFLLSISSLNTCRPYCSYWEAPFCLFVLHSKDIAHKFVCKGADYRLNQTISSRAAARQLHLAASLQVCLSQSNLSSVDISNPSHTLVTIFICLYLFSLYLIYLIFPS